MPKVGVIGTGWGARVQVPAFREAGLDVVAVAGHDPEKTRRVAAELDVQAFSDWRALVAEKEIDLVTIVTPPSAHLEMARAALESGKHVVSEKPTALDAVEARELVAVAERHPSQIAIIDHELRLLPAMRALRERIGAIGPLRYAEVRYSSPGRGDRKRAWNWWSDASQGGGVWGAVGSHFIDALRYLGFEIDAVQATLRSIIDRRPYKGDLREVTADDFAAVQLRLQGGAVATMTFSAVASVDEPTTLTLHGEEGGFRFLGEELQKAAPGGKFERIAGNDLSKRPGNSLGGAFGTGTFLLGQALAAALDRGDHHALEPAATFADGLAQQMVLDAGRISAAAGAWETIG
jgi:predicted dehydrogenase